MSSLTLESDVGPAAASHADRCLLCKGASRPWLEVPGDWRKPSLAGAFLLRWCDACGFGFLANRPAPEVLAEHYRLDAYYTHSDPQSADKRGRLWDRLRVRAAWSADHGLTTELDGSQLAAYGVSESGRVCDLGCGTGGLLMRLARAGYLVTGIEPDESARRVVAEAGLRVLPGSAELLPSAAERGSFDAVTMMHVLEHCLDPATALRNASELAAPGGLVVVETPNNACEGMRRAGPTWRWLDVPRHLNFFTPQSLQRLAADVGLEVVAVQYSGYTRQFLPDWIAEEREIRRRLKAMRAEFELPPVAGSRQALLLLATTWRAGDETKYDSVRVVGRKPREKS